MTNMTLYSGMLHNEVARVGKSSETTLGPRYLIMYTRGDICHETGAKLVGDDSEKTV